MSVYPFDIDDDNTIIRIDDNLSELGTEAINQLRDAVFAIEKELGINPAGSSGSVAARLDTSLNPDGTIKASALTSVGLATLPIVDNQVAVNAGIKEYKLTLDFGTADLHTLVLANATLLNSLSAFAQTTNTNLLSHIKGVALLLDGSTPGRHVGSQIDLNAVPTGPRDPLFVWEGLKDKFGNLRAATTVGRALEEINIAFVNHQNAVLDAHVATAVSVDTDDFHEIPFDANNVQKALNALDDAEFLNMGQHRATQHANAVPRITRSQAFNMPDGYRENVVPPTRVRTYLVTTPHVSPVDDTSIGDDIVKFLPEDPTSTYVFDSQFNQIHDGDIIRINYGNGIEAIYPIDSTRYIAGVEWYVRLNGVNLFDSGDGYDGYNDGYAYARIDRALYDRDTAGVLAVAPANAIPAANFSNLLSSVIVGNPQGATALGLGFDAGQLDSTHYKLYLELYPTGNPVDKVLSLPAIDVTGDAGASPGKYNLEKIAQQTNDSFRALGYNYRFIAFAHKGEFGLMLADPYGAASFAIISGDNSSGTLVTGPYTENVIGGNDISTDDFDALGLGGSHSNYASPAYQASFPDTTAAQLPTKVIPPLKQRYYIVNGRKRDNFAPTYNANEDGSWDAAIFIRNVVGVFTVEVTYKVELDLKAAGLKPGKTIVVQPAVPITDPTYTDNDYGRFIIKSVTFEQCPGVPDETLITVINGIHATGNPVDSSSFPGMAVKLFFSEDSVSFDQQNVVNQAPVLGNYSRLHEIYVNKEGVTFSHERSRIPMQVGTSELLGTARWHIRDVSAKFRGYRAGDPLVYDRFVRFYITAYDATSGEFEGHLGNPSGSDNGPTITGRKNVPIRFYDETNVDYIDLEFNDYDISPGEAILFPRHVDIEIFPTLKLDDEDFLLATCEVNWKAEVGKEIVEHVIDRRQFGSVDETDFTDSALEFISAGDRYLHDNGVIRGLDIDVDNPPIDNEIFFKGGLALVNGHISVLNNTSVTIPEVYDVNGIGPPPPQVVTWAICVTEKNTLEPIIVTPIKTQFFAAISPPPPAPSPVNYYVPSVTFTELINTRKDLTPIALVTVEISSIVVNSVTDLRKFVFSETGNPPLTLASGGFHGHFNSFTSLTNWINALENDRNLVTIKGNFDIDATVDLTLLNNGVVFEGDGAVLNVNVAQGFLVGSQVTFRNVNFVYNVDSFAVPYDPDDHINSGNGCIYRLVDSSFVNDIVIDNCGFSATKITGLAPAQRPPFINFEVDNGFGIDNLQITNCNFNDSGNPTTTFELGIQAAIAIVNLDETPLDNSSVLANANINNNICNLNQGIYTTSLVSTAGGITTISNPGLQVVNSKIEGNSCGIIGFLTSSVVNPSTLVRGLNKNSGLLISNNTCTVIATVDSTGKQLRNSVFINTASDYGLGGASILNNTCHWIHLWTSSGDNNTKTPAALEIQGNVLNAYDFDAFMLPSIYVNTVSPGLGVNTISNIAIIVHSDNLETDDGDCIISNNKINRWIDGGVVVRRYASGIYCETGALIENNAISGFEDPGSGQYIDGKGIIAGPTLNPPRSRQYTIQGNHISRNGRNIFSYFTSAFFNLPTSTGVFVDNFFDSDTVNGTDVNIKVPVLALAAGEMSAPLGWIVERNKNQTAIVQLPWSAGMTGLGSTNTLHRDAGIDASIIRGSISPSLTPDPGGLDLQYTLDPTETSGACFWQFFLSDSVPSGVEIIDFSFEFFMSTIPTSGTVRIGIASASGGFEQSPLPSFDLNAWGGAGYGGPIALSQLPLANRYFVHPEERCQVTLELHLADVAAVAHIFGYRAVLVTYRW